MDATPDLVFGPVPSRRFGRSLGINHVPAKTCSYACTYCQVGATTESTIEPRAFHPPETIAAQVARRLEEVRRAGGDVDVLTFVPDGEPTLDANLGTAIDLLGPLGVPVLVLSNASLLFRADVAEALGRADRVCLKVDAVREEAWRRVDRPHPSLRLERVLDGVARFARFFGGVLDTETMLVASGSDDEESVAGVASFLAPLPVHVAWLAVPTRPPAVAGVRRPSADALRRAFAAFAGAARRVELLAGDEGTAFSSTGDARRDLLTIAAVHPLREDAVRALLARSGASIDVVDALVAEGLLVRRVHEGRVYWARRPGERPGERTPP